MPRGDVTDRPDLAVMFEKIAAGDTKSINRLFTIVYEELCAMAHNLLRREDRGPPLKTTALVHEVYLRLCPGGCQGWRNRRHFFGAASRAMRQVLVDECRRRRALKRGGGRSAVPLDEGNEQVLTHDNNERFFDEVEALHLALDRFQAHADHERQAKVVEYRYFVGLTARETAEVLGVSENTVTNDWAYARAWLKREMLGEEDG